MADVAESTQRIIQRWKQMVFCAEKREYCFGVSAGGCLLGLVCPTTAEVLRLPASLLTSASSLLMSSAAYEYYSRHFDTRFTLNLGIALSTAVALLKTLQIKHEIFGGAFSKVTKAAGEIGQKTREKVGMAEDEQRQKMVDGIMLRFIYPSPRLKGMTQMNNTLLSQYQQKAHDNATHRPNV